MNTEQSEMERAQTVCLSLMKIKPFGLYYVGYRRMETTWVFFGDDGEIVGPLEARTGLGDTVMFDWGNDTAGAILLARAMLTERIAEETTDAVADFHKKCVAILPRDSWCLSGRNIAMWLRHWEQARGGG